jgi:hypothetical protein
MRRPALILAFAALAAMALAVHRLVQILLQPC